MKKWLYHGLNVIVVLVVLREVYRAATTDNVSTMIVFAVFALVAWFSAQGALISLASIYNAVPEHLRFATAVSQKSRWAVLAYMFTSYFGTVIAFAILYYQIAADDAEAFRGPINSAIDAIYFSVVTGATVGYGDIHPVDPWAKILVIAQILLSLVYTIFFFSVAASFLRGPEERR